MSIGRDLVNADQSIKTSTRKSQSIDRGLLLKVQQGNERAMEILYERNSRLVFRVAIRILGDTAAAEDVVQEVFMRIWRHPYRFIEAKGEFCAWIAVVSKNCAIDVLRIRRRRPSEPIDDFKLASSFDLSHHAEMNIFCEKANTLIDGLPTEHQRLIRLAFIEGMSHSEIATTTGRPLGTIKTRIRNALTSLRNGFEHEIS